MWPDEKLEKEMLADAELMTAYSGEDCACHVKALLTRVRTLEAALKPFADRLQETDRVADDVWVPLKMGDCRKARKVLEGQCES